MERKALQGPLTRNISRAGVLFQYVVKDGVKFKFVEAGKLYLPLLELFNSEDESTKSFRNIGNY